MAASASPWRRITPAAVPASCPLVGEATESPGWPPASSRRSAEPREASSPSERSGGSGGAAGRCSPAAEPIGCRRNVPRRATTPSADGGVHHARTEDQSPHLSGDQLVVAIKLQPRPQCEGLSHVRRTRPGLQVDRRAARRSTGGHATEVRHGGCGHDRQHGPAMPLPRRRKRSTSQSSTETILAVAATAEVLATIVNTVGWERGLGRDAVTQRNIKAAARQGARALQRAHLDRRQGCDDQDLGAGWRRSRCNRTNLLNTLQVGDDLRQRLPDRHQALRRFGERQLRRDHGGVHGRRGRAPRAGTPVAWPARQRPGRRGSGASSWRTRRGLPTWGSRASRTS